MYFVTLLVAAAAVSVAYVSAVCPGSADKCLNKDAFSKLSQSNANDYCVKGAVLYASAQSCLNECKTTDTSGYLDTVKKTFNDFALKADPNCTNLFDTYINQTNCFPQYGGADTVNKILSTFDDTGSRSNDDCQKLYWGRNCQKLTTCSFNLLLDLQLMAANSDAVLGLAVCGSEKAAEIETQIEDNSGCSTTDIDSNVQSNCNIACDIKDAETAEDICAALEKQAANLEKYTAGCANAQRTYILPRLDTYALANAKLGCNIKFKNLEIRAPIGSMCNYTTILNNCFFARAVDNAIDFYRLQPLFNGDMPIVDFCKNLGSSASLISNCIQSVLPCAVPQAKLLARSPTYLENFNVNLGGLPLNGWGASWVLKFAVTACTSNVAWTTPICNPQPLEVTTGNPTKQVITTKIPVVKVPNQAKNDIPAGDYQQQSDDGGHIVVSFALVSFSVLTAFFSTM